MFNRLLFIIVIIIICIYAKNNARVIYTLDIENNCKVSTFEGYCKHRRECWDTIIESINKYNTTKHVCVLPTNTTISGSFAFINQNDNLYPTFRTENRGPRLIFYYVNHSCESIEGQGCTSYGSCMKLSNKMFHKLNTNNHPYICASYAFI